MIRSATQNAIATITIDRPERRNALAAADVTGLGAAIRAALDDDACRVLVLRGAGGTFCSGRDLADARADAPLGDVLAYDEAWCDILRALTGARKPSVAMVTGHAVAGGFTLAMGCNFVIADRAARFGALEMRGDFPAAVNCAVLSRLVGPRKALEYLLSADTFPAEHLLAAGLVNHLADGPEAVETIAGDVAGRLATLDPVAVRLTMDAHRMAATMPVHEAITMGGQLNSLLMSSGRILAAADKHKRTR